MKGDGRPTSPRIDKRIGSDKPIKYGVYRISCTGNQAIKQPLGAPTVTIYIQNLKNVAQADPETKVSAIIDTGAEAHVGDEKLAELVCGKNGETALMQKHLE